MTRTPPRDSEGLDHRSVLERWEALSADAIRRFESSGELDGVLEALAMTVALEALGDLSRAAPGRRESLRKTGARALLQIGTLLAPQDNDEHEERAEGVRIAAPYARDGLRALAGKEPPRSTREDDPTVLDSELVGLARGAFDGFRLAEIATRVRDSTQAQRALLLLRRLEEQADVGRAAPRLRLAADGASSVRDPEQGRRIAELRLGVQDVELYRFEDGVIAAYATTAVVLRLAGAGVTSLVSRAGYAEAALEGRTHRVDLDAGGERATLEL